MTNILKHKHSRDAGTVPNLIPGQIGINWADETFWLRTAGKKVGVSIQKWQNYSAPSLHGIDGAPLRQTDEGPAWDTSLTPSSVVDGQILVDPSTPSSIYGIPGINLTSVTGLATLGSTQVIRERFYVASDSIRVDRAAVSCLSGGGGQAKIVIADDDDNILTVGNISSITAGVVNTANMSIDLVRGWYKIFFWSNVGANYGLIRGTLFDQGFNIDGSGVKHFKDRDFANVDWTSSTFVTGIGFSELTTTTPGMRRIIAMRWTLP